MRMNPRFASSLATILASLLLCANAVPAQAQTFRVGRLLCSSTPRVGLVLSSAQELRCVFVATNPRGQYVYEGRIRLIGLDFGVTSAGTLSWAVFARNSRPARCAATSRSVPGSGPTS